MKCMNSIDHRSFVCLLKDKIVLVKTNTILSFMMFVKLPLIIIDKSEKITTSLLWKSLRYKNYNLYKNESQ